MRKQQPRIGAGSPPHFAEDVKLSLVTEMGHLARALSLFLSFSPALIDARAFSRTRRARGRSRLPDKLCKRNFPIVPPHLPPSPRCVAPYARILSAWKRMLRFVPQTAAYFNILPLCIMHVRADRFALTARPLTAPFNIAVAFEGARLAITSTVVTRVKTCPRCAVTDIYTPRTGKKVIQLPSPRRASILPRFRNFLPLQKHRSLHRS